MEKSNIFQYDTFELWVYFISGQHHIHRPTVQKAWPDFIALVDLNKSGKPAVMSQVTFNSSKTNVMRNQMMLLSATINDHKCISTLEAIASRLEAITIRFLLLLGSIPIRCLTLSPLVSRYLSRYSFVTSSLTFAICMARMWSLTFGDCQRLVSHVSVAQSVAHHDYAHEVSCILGRSKSLVLLSSCEGLGSAPARSCEKPKSKDKNTFRV